MKSVERLRDPFKTVTYNFRVKVFYKDGQENRERMIENHLVFENDEVAVLAMQERIETFIREVYKDVVDMYVCEVLMFDKACKEDQIHFS